MPFVNQGYSGNLNRAIVLFNRWMNVDNTIITSTSLPAQGPENLRDQSTYNFWLPTNPGAWVQFEFNNPINCNSFGVAAHNAGTSGGGIQLLSSDDGVNFDTILVSYSPTTDEDLLFLFPQVTTKYLRVRQTVSPFSIGVTMAGSAFAFPCTPIDSYTPTHHSKRYNKRFNNSIEGHLLSNRVVSAGGQTSVSFPLLNRDWVDGPLPSFENAYNSGYPFFYAGWPGGKPQDCAYAWAGSDDGIIEVEYNHADKLASVSFDMRFYRGV